ncbi:hypothetical protein [Rathayibacter tritici]|uniref:hypothetical protein n=1 Tax=Rathayibacter tritici TaxID=33888 RepID=UPI00147673D0|nr:hypothetical protein [Rathayibacter tritici]
MAIATEWTIQHSCGHTAVKDLSKKAAGERAGFAAWLGKKPCFDCKDAAGERELSKEFLAERAAAEAAAVEAAERLGLAPLRGSEKQLDWAMRVRHELLISSYETLVAEGGMSEQDYDAQIIAPAQTIDAARWWIDNRDMAAADLPELLADAGTTSAASSENPY